MKCKIDTDDGHVNYFTRGESSRDDTDNKTDNKIDLLQCLTDINNKIELIVERRLNKKYSKIVKKLNNMVEKHSKIRVEEYNKLTQQVKTLKDDNAELKRKMENSKLIQRIEILEDDNTKLRCNIREMKELNSELHNNLRSAIVKLNFISMDVNLDNDIEDIDDPYGFFEIINSDE